LLTIYQDSKVMNQNQKFISNKHLFYLKTGDINLIFYLMKISNKKTWLTETENYLNIFNNE